MAIREYVGARYVPKFSDPTEWSEGRAYEALTIVTYNGSSYTSKKPVPDTVGNPYDNPDYWALTGNYNAQVQEYREAVEELREEFHDIIVTPQMFGAVADGVTDDLSAFEQAVEASDFVYVPYGTYYLSNALTIDKQRIEILLSPDATIFTDVATTTGNLIGFIGYGTGQGTATFPQREYAKISGGTIYATSPNGDINNVIGVSRYKNFICENVHITLADKKAITAQYGVDNIIIKNNIIDTSIHNAISIEYSCNNVVIAENKITSRQKGINLDDNINNVVVRDNVISATSERGIYAYNISNLTIKNNVIGSDVKECVFIHTAKDGCFISGNSFMSCGTTSDCIVIYSPTTRPIIVDNSEYVEEYNSFLNTTNASGYEAITIGNILNTGTEGAFKNWKPVINENLIDGLPSTPDILTASWTAASSSSAGARLTDSLSLPPGLYLIYAKTPYSTTSGDNVLQLVNYTGTMYGFDAITTPISYGLALWMVNITEDSNPFIQTGQATSLSWDSNYLDRGGLFAVKIG